jgi:hypothetical protein
LKYGIASLMLLALAGVCAAQTSAPAAPCFTITVDSQMSSDNGKHTEEHHIQATYRPVGRESCNVAALSPGSLRRFYLADIHATSSGRDGTESASTRLDGVTQQNRDASVTITRQESGATLEFSADSPTSSSEDCQQCIHMCAAQSFEPFPNAFELTEQDLTHFSTLVKTVSLNMPDGLNGCVGTAKATLNAKLGVEEEMIFEPGNDYVSWLPAPDAKQMQGIRFSASPPLAVTVRIRPKQGGGEARSGRIEFRLEEVTRHTGVCGNFPRGGAEKDDLRFADNQPEGIAVEGKTAHTTDEVSEATVYVQAMDFAAWGRIKASAPKLSLNAVYKPTNTYSLTIPRDDDGNHIADAWEGAALEPGVDDEEVAGQTARGDGLTAASEYRGLVVLENGEKVHRRLNPKRKELFVIDSGGIFDTAAWERASDIVVFKVDESMVQGGSDRRQSRIVNFLPGPDRTHKYAVRLETVSGSKDPDDPKGDSGDWGYTTEWPISSPKDVVACRVFKDRIRAALNTLYLWLGKALTVPGSPEAAELQASGFPRFLAQRALNQLGPGQVENLANQLIRLAAIHEMGHALGLPGHTDAQGNEGRIGATTCPMRYLNQKNATQLIILQTLFAPDAALPGEVKRFCGEQFQCFRKLNVKD